MSSKRIKYDWLFIIKDNGLGKAFRIYKKYHPNISEKRAARAFVLRSKINFRYSCYQVGNLQNKESYFCDIAQCNWIDD